MFTPVTLYDKGSNGQIKVWSIRVEKCSDGSGDIQTEFGRLGGTLQVKSKVITKGKNIGKSNETTPYEQACKEAESTVKKKRDKGYRDSLSDVEAGKDNGPKLPKLAHDYTKRGHDIVMPCAAQPKLNGVRCLVEKLPTGAIQYTSRKGKVFTTLGHLDPHFDRILKTGDVMDGEIYVHGWSFQAIIRAVKKKRDDTVSLEFHAYDLPSDLDYIDRGANLLNLVSGETMIKFVTTDKVETKEEIQILHDKWVKQGYEGLILRNLKGGYVYKHRSKNLQKYKEFIDEEFLICGGVADADGCVVFEVANPKGLTADAMTFNVRPRGTVQERKKWLADIGKMSGVPLTVRYQELSEDNVPIFPVGIAIRDYE